MLEYRIHVVCSRVYVSEVVTDNPECADTDAFPLETDFEKKSIEEKSPPADNVDLKQEKDLGSHNVEKKHEFEGYHSLDGEDSSPKRCRRDGENSLTTADTEEIIYAMLNTEHTKQPSNERNESRDKLRANSPEQEDTSGRTENPIEFSAEAVTSMESEVSG